MIPGYEIIVGNNAGSFTGGGNKLLLHTTEGTTANGAIGAFRRNNSWPHFTLSFEEKRKIQHLETNVAARSLKNDPDGYDTNRACCVQVEIVGFATEAGSWTSEKLDWLAERFKEIQNVFRFVLSYPAFAIPAKRFTDKEFVEFAGICGHEHAPDNNHFDPGALKVAYIVSKMGGSVPSGQIKGVEVSKELVFRNVKINTDNDGNGFFDLYHNQSGDPQAAIPVTNGNRPSKDGGYVQVGRFATASYDGKFVTVQVVGANPRGTVTCNVVMFWG